MVERRRRVQNRVLRTLPAAEYRRLTTRSRLVHLDAGAVLHDADRGGPYIYFPMTGLCSIALANQDGECMQVGVVGCEGVTSVFDSYSAVPDARLVVTVRRTDAIRVPVEDFENELDRRLMLRSRVRHFYNAFHSELMLSVACNRLHSLRQRYCRHILGFADRLASDHVHVNHFVMAAMLGATRPSVTLVSAELKRTGAIAYRRNALTILNRDRIESTACGCYHTIRQHLTDLLPPTQ